MLIDINNYLMNFSPSPNDSAVGKPLNFIDIMKFLMAFCVICAHTWGMTHYPLSDVAVFVIWSSVPFFFVTSGYFVWEKFSTSGYDFNVFGRYGKKLLLMHLFWVAVYLPIDCYAMMISDRPFYYELMIYVRGLLFVGDTFVGRMLWYLYTAMITVFVVGRLIRKQVPLLLLWTIGLAFVAIGYAIIQTDFNTASPASQKLLRLFFLTFTTNRNPIFYGLCFITTGMVVNRYLSCIKAIKYNLLIGALLLMLAIVLYNNGCCYWALTSGTALFIICKSISLKNQPIFQILRRIGVIIYLVHMYIVWLLHYYLPQNVSFVWYTSLCVIFSLVVAILIYYISKHERMKWFRRFING